MVRPRFTLKEGADFLLLPSINQSHHNSEDAPITRGPLYKEGPEARRGEGLA